MDSGQLESICATVPICQFLSLSDEVEKNGRSAISNRMTFASRSRQRGDIPAAEDAEKQAEVMQRIAIEKGFRL